MGRDNNNAGIHLVPKGYNGRTDIVDRFDRYGAMIVEHKLNKKGVAKDELLDIEVCNFITILSKRGERNDCLCGGKLKYEEALMIRFHHHNNMVYIKMPGKKCIDCERKFVVEKELCERLAEAKGKIKII